MKRILLCIAWIAVSGCAEEQPTAPAPETSQREAEEPVRDRPSEAEMVAAMEAHYEIVISSHDALLEGDLQAFRSQLAVVTELALPTGSPPEWLALHERLKAAAAEAASASTLDEAANRFGSVALACGQCHAALGTGPIYPAPAPDEGADAVETAMLDHQWATERLWEGVTGPWDNAWQRGAESLAALQLFGEAGAEITFSADLRRREQELRTLGERATTTTALSERAALYGRLLSTCAACHRAAGVTLEETR